MNARRAPITPAEAREAVLAVARHGGHAQAARALGLSRCALIRRVRRAEGWGITAHGEITASEARPVDARPGALRRFLFTAAQSNTHAHPDFWENLRALADHYGAEIMVARVRYNHSAGQVAQEKEAREADGGLWYDPALEPYFRDERLEIAPGLIWAGDMNILPTATDPLSGLDSFTGLASCVFPHPQIALKSIATAPGRAAKFNYTTGAVTLKNYIKRKAGLKAEFHHAFAALLVEVDPAGDWWARQVNATDTGAICDLDVKVDGGVVETGQRVEVLTPGDLHGTRADPAALSAVWGPGGLVDTLRPRAQVLHDVLNFGARGHHNTLADTLRLYFSGADSVAREIDATAAMVLGLLRPDCLTYIAKANHDEHLDRWLRETDWRRDPPNAAFFLQAAGAWVDALQRGEDFDPAAWALRRAGLPPDVVFLTRADTLVLSGIRHDLHGDLGPNGARGSARNLARMGEKVNIGHSHSAAIFQGAYQGGTLSELDMGYNRGPSSWSQSLVLTYSNGKRAIVTLRAGKWKATP